jgi:hypothetical protein
MRPMLVGARRMGRGPFCPAAGTCEAREDGESLSGYDHPLDLGSNVRRKIAGGEITEY